MKLKLTDEMHLEVILMQSRIVTIGQEFGYHANKSFNPLPTTYKDELESYKVKLENFYSDTDLKEQLNKWLIYISGASFCFPWLLIDHAKNMVRVASDTNMTLPKTSFNSVTERKTQNMEFAYIAWNDTWYWFRGYGEICYHGVATWSR